MEGVVLTLWLLMFLEKECLCNSFFLGIYWASYGSFVVFCVGVNHHRGYRETTVGLKPRLSPLGQGRIAAIKRVLETYIEGYGEYS